eukprot:TRINITY_DN1999_c3_g1_i1.p1 TRINITY_DN1999_c3_g1~~TRINITY_DN1999_c3_g1_i1.p1  ORF type:complete len:419 (+),score=44.77 TRINITY_DN1999_c3_g1_i1:171-1427(+)
MCWFLGYFLLIFPRTWSRRLEVMMSNFMGRCEVWVDTSIRVSGPVYIVLAVTLISGVIYVYFTALLPLMAPFLSIKGFLHTLLALWLAGNVFFNYYMCITTDPGTPPEHIDAAPDASFGSSYSDRLVEGQGSIRWCKRCRKPKPPMTHHCHVCNRCILKMDHHCPWMHNCIGFHNYRYFFLFLAYMWVGCAYATLMSATPILYHKPDRILEAPPVGILFTFVLSLAVWVALTLLFGWHCYLVATAQTTIDFHANRQRMREAVKLGEVWENEFDLGVKRNCMTTFEVSGPWWFLLLFLPRTTPLRGDGIRFPMRDDGYQRSNIVFANYPELPQISSSSVSPSLSDHASRQATAHFHSGATVAVQHGGMPRNDEVVSATSTARPGEGGLETEILGHGGEREFVTPAESEHDEETEDESPV